MNRRYFIFLKTCTLTSVMDKLVFTYKTHELDFSCNYFGIENQIKCQLTISVVGAEVLAIILSFVELKYYYPSPPKKINKKQKKKKLTKNS